nr:MAG TPA: hypothetical protein [Bacteriophage sp.]
MNSYLISYLILSVKSISLLLFERTINLPTILYSLYLALLGSSA